VDRGYPGYEARVQIGVRLPYGRHDDEVDGDVNVDR